MKRKIDEENPDYLINMKDLFSPDIVCDTLVMSKEKTEKPYKLEDMANRAGVSGGILFHNSLGDVEATINDPCGDEVSILSVRLNTEEQIADRKSVV